MNVCVCACVFVCLHREEPIWIMKNNCGEKQILNFEVEVKELNTLLKSKALGDFLFNHRTVL